MDNVSTSCSVSKLSSIDEDIEKCSVFPGFISKNEQQLSHEIEIRSK